jgi:hypothetical protein
VTIPVGMIVVAIDDNVVVVATATAAGNKKSVRFKRTWEN